MSDQSLFLTSVVVASFVASIISGLFAFVTVILDRRARHKELVFTKALELAKLKVDTLIDLHKTTGTALFTADPVEYAEWYYGILQHLHRTGRLNKSWEDDYDKRFSGRTA